MPLSVSKRRILKRPTTGSQRIHSRNRFKTTFILVSSCLLLTGVLVAAGFAYAWYSGSLVAPDTLSQVEYKPAQITKQPTQKNQRVNVILSNATSPIAAGEMASLSVRTNNDAVCQVEAMVNNQKIEVPKLTPSAADEYGIATWKWEIAKTTQPGTWQMTVTCSNEQFSGMLKTPMVITAPTAAG